MAGPFRSGEEIEERVDAEPATESSLDTIARELRDAYFGFLAFAQLVRGDPRIPTEVHDTALLMAAEAERMRALSEQLVERARTAEVVALRTERRAGIH